MATRLIELRNPGLWKRAKFGWVTAALASALVSQPLDAATFHCGKTFVTFQAKHGDVVGIFTVRKEAIIHVLTNTNRDVSSLRIRSPDGEAEIIPIDEATHDRLIECLD